MSGVAREKLSQYKSYGLADLSVEEEKTSSTLFRYGFLEIDEEFFKIIAEGMLGFDPRLGRH